MSAPAPSDDHKEQPKVEVAVAAAEKPAKPAKAPKEKKEKAADDAADTPTVLLNPEFIAHRLAMWDAIKAQQATIERNGAAAPMPFRMLLLSFPACPYIPFIRTAVHDVLSFSLFLVCRFSRL
jgi:hypothetical protein